MKLKNKRYVDYQGIVHDITVKNTHSYNIEGLAVHNSASGSLVAFLSGITTIDPMKYGLIFERFHNNQKTSFPDIDSDFADPSKVKVYLKEKYGEDRVASISNWSTLSPKVIIKDVARSLVIGGDKSTAFKIANHITSLMPDEKTIEKAMAASPKFNSYMKKYPELYENASKLQGLTRNWSVHAAGIIMSDRPLYEHVPLRIDSKTGLVAAQWEKTRCEENGLIKYDILGLKTLTVMDDTFDLINLTQNKNISTDDIDLHDEETYNMIGRGETSGVFQLESSLTPLCIKIKPHDVEGISDINALGRPSCSAEQRADYIRRKLGIDKAKYTHDSLKNALEKTFGVSLYEEGMMTIAKDCAGWDLNQADALRKITKLKGKDPQLVEKTKSSFIADCMKVSNMNYQQAAAIWRDEIEPFGLYGFNKSHSVSYSHISYYTAWLRCHYPTEFICALLNSEDGNSDKSLEYLSSCSDMGIEISPPDINFSGGTYHPIGDKLIATGLAAIKGIGDTAVGEILELQPFTSIEDFFFRTNGRVINKRVIHALAKCGAFKSLNRTRKDLFENYAKYRTKVNNEKKKGKTIEQIYLPEYNQEWDRKELLLNEREVLGRTISGSLHEVFTGFFMKNSQSTPLRRIKDLEIDTNIKIEVIIASKIKEFTIKKGKNIGKKFAKYLVEDAEGSVAEMTVWANDYEKYQSTLEDGLPMKAICKVDEYMEKKSISLSLLESVLGKVV